MFAKPIAVFVALVLCFGASTSVEAAAADSAEAAHGDAHAGPHLGHADANTSPSEVKGDLAIFSAIVFLLLVVILRKFAWKPIAAGLDKRESHIAHEIAAAEKANADAKLLLAEYQKKIEVAHAETRAILEEARRDAEHTKQEIVAKAKSEAAAETARGLREINTAKDQALDDLAKVAVDQALALAGKLLQQKLQAADHARLVDEALGKFSSKKTANLN